MLDAIPKMRVTTPTKPSFTMNGKYTRPSQNEWNRKGDLDDETRRDL